MDVTGSMQGPITNLKSGISQLTKFVRDTVPDSQFGVAGYADFPISPFGQTCSNGTDQPFFLHQSVTADFAKLTTGIGSLKLLCGVDEPESMLEAAC